jgi:hypothetical protein
MRSSGTTCRWSASPDDGAESAIEHWTEREIDKAAFKDARLGQRFGELLKQIGDGMGGSIPLACQDWASTKAAYRFFANERVEEADILSGHLAATRTRYDDCGPDSPHSGHDGILLPTCEYERHRPDQERQ